MKDEKVLQVQEICTDCGECKHVALYCSDGRRYCEDCRPQTEINRANENDELRDALREIASIDVGCVTCLMVVSFANAKLKDLSCQWPIHPPRGECTGCGRTDGVAYYLEDGRKFCKGCLTYVEKLKKEDQ